jgi:hypothetical protein
MRATKNLFLLWLAVVVWGLFNTVFNTSGDPVGDVSAVVSFAVLLTIADGIPTLVGKVVRWRRSRRQSRGA